MENVKRCLVIVNPTSGRERAPKYIPLLSSVLSKRYDDVSIKLTQKAGDAKNFARRAAERIKTSSAWAATVRLMKSLTAWFLSAAIHASVLFLSER